MSGIYGWLGPLEGDRQRTMASMRLHTAGRVAKPSFSVSGDGFALGACGPPSTTFAGEFGPLSIAFHGHPSWHDGGNHAASGEAFCELFAEAYRMVGVSALDSARGDFAIALIDSDRAELLLAIDRIGIRNLVYCGDGDVLVFGPDSDVLADHPATKMQLDAQGIYNFMYYHMVPGPGTVFTGHSRLLPGHYLQAKRGSVATKSYWTPTFLEGGKCTVSELAPDFRSALRQGVDAFASDVCGTFLSGGTDSSTVSGILGEVTGAPARTYSIGFDAAGYDEMAYARIAAKHFRTNHHEYYVTPADVVDAIPIVAAAYGQPFGNASAVPTYFCAKLAREDGVERMLGGDGGDELFGGNTRYAKQYQFSLYGLLPQAIRGGAIEPMLLGLPGIERVPVLRKARSYVAQARLAMPLRYESYNLLERLGSANVLDEQFLASVDRSRPIALMKEVYDSAKAGSLVNRMLALDLKFTLADNDLPKVTRMCDAAGVDVAFPLLHESVVDFAATLPPDFKLRRTKLRYFFKEALRGYLPAEILTKKKHGFGLPVGIWLQTYAPLRQLAGDSLTALKRRRIVRSEMIDALLSRHLASHAGYYGTLVWILMMLELWFQNHVDRGSGARSP
jgi:asparagine synthase (glutamine-hydrolysing)